jgi:hypothetical protein
MKQLKKFFALVLSCVFLLSFSGCIRSQERELEKIPTNGDYIMRSGLFMNQGNTVVDIKDEIRKKIMKEKFLIADDVDYCETFYTEKDGIIYFVMCYEQKNREYHNEINRSMHDSYYAFGYTPIFDVDVKIMDYFMVRHAYGGCRSWLLDKYIFLEFEKINDSEFAAYNIETLERVDFEAQGYTYYTSTEDAIMLTKKEGNMRYYRIYDENLSVYEYSKERDGLTEVLYGEYLLFYDKNSPEETAQAIRYKTNEVLSSEESFAVYQEMQIKPEAYSFEYNGEKYAIDGEEVHEYISTGEFDENGEEILKSKEYLKLIFTNIETQEIYETTNIKLMERAPQMKDIQAIYNGVVFNSFGIYEQDGELYFLFWNDHSFFGTAIFSKATPQMVFKYKAEAKELEYIGFAYRGVTRIYEGIL